MRICCPILDFKLLLYYRPLASRAWGYFNLFDLVGGGGWKDWEPQYPAAVVSYMLVTWLWLSTAATDDSLQSLSTRLQ